MSESREPTWEEMLKMMEQSEQTQTDAEKFFEEVFGENAPKTKALTKKTRQPAPFPEQPVPQAPTFEELKQALPILGLAVMVKEEYKGHYPSYIHGRIGHIFDRNGMSSSAKRVIQKYKDNQYVEDWKVKVVFNGERYSITIRHLEISEYQGEMIKVIDNLEGEYRYFLKDSKEYFDFMDRRAILDKYPVSIEQEYNYEYMKKIYDEA